MSDPQSTSGLPVRRKARRSAAFVSAALAATLMAGAQKPAAPVAPTAPADASSGHSAAYYHYGLAHIYEDLATTQGRSDYATQAIEQYKLALNADPNSTYLQDGLSELYFKVGRIREAVQVAQDQVKKNPNDVEAHRLLGRIYYRSLGDLQNGAQAQMVQLATTEYETLVRLEPNSVENHLLLGQLYELSKDSAKAEAQFKAAQGIDNGSEESLLNLARLYSEQGDTQRVINTLSALPEDNRSARIELALGSSYDQMHKPKEAAAAYQRALDDEGDNLDAQRGLANALLTDGQLEPALKQFQAIVTTEPQDAQSYIRISDIQRRQGHYDQALDTLKKAKAIVPDSQELSYNEALVYDSLGRFSDAEQTLQAALATTDKPDHNYTDGDKNNRAIFLDRLGNLYREENRTSQAVDSYKQMIALGGDYRLRGYNGEIDSYRDAHQWEQATAVAAEAAKALPADRDVQTVYAGQLADSGKVEEGVALLKKQLNGKPEDRTTYLSLAQMDIRLRRWADAKAALDKAEVFSQKPDDKVYLYYLRGTLADKEKHSDEAETWFRKLLELDPNNANALNTLGYMFADRGVKLPEALTLVKKALELDPQNYAYLDSLGWVYFRQGQYQMAEDTLQKAVDRDRNDPTVHDHLGQAFEKQGKLKQAVQQWERAEEEYKQSLAADVDQEDILKLHKRLDSARVKLAKNAHESKVTP